VAARSKALICRRSPAETVGSNPTGGMNVCRECYVLSGRGLCNELITRPEESYRLWCVVVCDLETSWMRRPWPTGGCCAKNKQNKQTNYYYYCYCLLKKDGGPRDSNIKIESKTRIDLRDLRNRWPRNRICWSFGHQSLRYRKFKQIYFFTLTL